jgi:hypothetical protein
MSWTNLSDYASPNTNDNNCGKQHYYPKDDERFNLNRVFWPFVIKEICSYSGQNGRDQKMDFKLPNPLNPHSPDDATISSVFSAIQLT